MTAADKQQEMETVRVRVEPVESDVQVLFANSFNITFHDDGFILSVGQLVPPVLLGNEEEQREQLRELQTVPLHVLARFALTRQRVDQLIDVLVKNRESFDKAIAGGGLALQK